MNILKSWLKNWVAKDKNSDPITPELPVTEEATPQYHAEFYKNYFSLIANGVRLKLVEAMFNLNLFALFENETSVLERDIIDQLHLMPIRAQKWLHLLCCEHFLKKVKIKNQTAYQLSDGFRQLMASKNWWATQFFFNTWYVAANEDLTDVLRYGKAKISVSWPPKTDAEVFWLEDWMTRTASGPITTLLENINYKKVHRLLDVGGGDGTMACALVAAHPHLQATVYNLPKSAEMARNTINSHKLSQQVSVLEGDFIAEDAFPVGFDLILFTRVLFDWNEKVNRKLLRMAYQALPKNGLVAICEFFKEDSNDKCLASEYRYIFHDDFTPHVMKTAAEYRIMLKEIGFTILLNDERKKATHYSILLAQK